MNRMVSVPNLADMNVSFAQSVQATTLVTDLRVFFWLDFARWPRLYVLAGSFHFGSLFVGEAAGLLLR